MLYCYFFIQISSFIVKLCIVTDYNLQIYSYCSIPVHIQMSPVGMKCPYSFRQHARDSAHSPLEHAEIDVFMFDGRELWVLTASYPGVLLPSEEKWLWDPRSDLEKDPGPAVLARIGNQRCEQCIKINYNVNQDLLFILSSSKIVSTSGNCKKCIIL